MYVPIDVSKSVIKQFNGLGRSFKPLLTISKYKMSLKKKKKCYTKRYYFKLNTYVSNLI